jgi:Putative zinc-finger
VKWRQLEVAILTSLRRAKPSRRFQSLLHVEREGPLSIKPHITCQELIDFIGSYRDNELTPDQRVEFERHLSVCPSCVAYLKTYAQTIALSKAAADDPVPEDVPESLVQAILSARRQMS